MRIRVGDEVIVVRGKDRGKTGKIEKVFPKKHAVQVGGVNQYKRHRKARSANQPSEIITITKPLPVGNVQLLCPKCHVPTRVGFVQENGKKRVCRKCEQVL